MIAHKSLLLKLLALKADATGCRREEMVREIFKTAEAQKLTLTEDELVLVDAFVNAYSQVPEEELTQIKKEVNMIAGETITEHYQLIGIDMGKKLGKEIGMEAGIELGKEIGEEIGRIKGAIDTFNQLLAEGLITEELHHVKIQSLKTQLAVVQARSA